jgi:hypothetical protein
MTNLLWLHLFAGVSDVYVEDVGRWFHWNMIFITINLEFLWFHVLDRYSLESKLLWLNFCLLPLATSIHSLSA